MHPSSARGARAGGRSLGTGGRVRDQPLECDAAHGRALVGTSCLDDDATWLRGYVWTRDVHPQRARPPRAADFLCGADVHAPGAPGARHAGAGCRQGLSVAAHGRYFFAGSGATGGSYSSTGSCGEGRTRDDRPVRQGDLGDAGRYGLPDDGPSDTAVRDPGFVHRRSRREAYARGVRLRKFYWNNDGRERASSVGGGGLVFGLGVLLNRRGRWGFLRYHGD